MKHFICDRFSQAFLEKNLLCEHFFADRKKGITVLYSNIYYFQNSKSKSPLQMTKNVDVNYLKSNNIINNSNNVFVRMINVDY